MFLLVYLIIYAVSTIILSLFNLEVLVTLFMLVVLVPGVAITARRLHDTGKSGWWQLLGLIPVLGILIMIVLLAQKGTEGENAYGPEPQTGAPEPLTEVVPEEEQ